MRLKRNPPAPSERHWYWEIPLGGGPHSYLNLEWAPRHAASFHSAALERLPASFRKWENPYRPQVWMHPNSREWGWTEIELRPSSLTVTRGWGGVGDSDTPLIHELLSFPLDLTQWRVLSGGDGYATRYFRSGPDRDSFFAYLQSQPAPPDFEGAQQQLIKSLAAHGWDEKYRPGEAVEEAGQLKIPLLYDVPRIDGAWQREPAGSELEILAREISDQCALPVLASITSEHTPDDFYQVIGGSILFGLRQRS